MKRNTFNTRTASPEELDAHRRQIAWIPAEAEKIERDTTDAVVYRWERPHAGKSAWRIVGFVGKRGKPALDIYIRESDKGDGRIRMFLDNSQSWTDYKAERPPRRRQGPDMSQYTEGTILHSQTSYSMTFNHYYQIVKVKGQSIVVRPLENIKITGGGWTGTEHTAKDAFVGDKEYTARVTHKGAMIEGRHAHLWNGRPNYYNTVD